MMGYAPEVRPENRGRFARHASSEAIVATLRLVALAKHQVEQEYKWLEGLLQARADRLEEGATE